MAAATAGGGGWWATAAWSAATAPAVTIAAAASPATALVASAPAPAVMIPPATLPPALRRRCGRAGACGRSGAAPAGAGAALAPPATCAPPAEAVEPSFARNSFLSSSSGPTGRISGERVVVVLELLAEEGAALAVAHVAARGRAELGQPLGDLAELEADLLAVELAGLGGLGEADARSHEQRLDGWDGGLHGVGDLVVGERVDLTQQQRGALGLGQLRGRRR